MRAGRILLIVLLIGIAAFSQGCVAAAVGIGAAGTVAYVRGDLEAVESENLDAVYEAAVKAVDELDLRVISKSKDALTATINARDAQDKKIKITLKNTAEQTTKISIRIGYFGSETKSRLIYQKIHDNLRS
ncbi:MAG: DUF3568 family protein [Sedimentisphaerales bacterium]|nr:DUF3568 family protein [Sedimentisphaerales bacterium]